MSLLNVGARALLANQVALQTAGHNIANVNTPGYSRQTVVLQTVQGQFTGGGYIGKGVDVQTIFHKMEQRTLAAAYKFYCDKSLENAHSAEADTYATYEVLKAQLDRYPELENDIKYLSEFSSFNTNVDFAGRMVYDDNGVEVFNFGKYKGMSVAEVLKKDPGYYSWILNSDFTLNTKAALTKIRLREMSNLITK